MKIVVVDDDRLVALSLKTILESSGKVTIAAIGNSGAEALKLYDMHLPDVLLMDIRMEGMSGIDAGEILLRKYPEARILYLTTFSDDAYIVKALNMGAKGYILKQDFEGITPALETVMRGQRVFGEEVINRLPQILKAKSEFDETAYALSSKEVELIALVAKGLSNKEIASQLFLSEGTVRNYISGILEKLMLRDRTQLAIFYYTKMQ